MSDEFYVNIDTGETLNVDSSDEKLCEAYKAVMMKIKEYERIAAPLKQAIMDRIRPGDTKFGDFFDIQTQMRTRLVFPDKETEKIYKKTISDFSRQYQEEYKLTLIKFPKY